MVIFFKTFSAKSFLYSLIINKCGVRFKRGSILGTLSKIDFPKKLFYSVTLFCGSANDFFENYLMIRIVLSQEYLKKKIVITGQFLKKLCLPKICKF